MIVTTIEQDRARRLAKSEEREQALPIIATALGCILSSVLLAAVIVSSLVL